MMNSINIFKSGLLNQILSIFIGILGGNFLLNLESPNVPFNSRQLSHEKSFSIFDRKQTYVAL